METFHFYHFSRVFRLILIFEDISLFSFVKTGVTFQGVLIIRIQRDNYIPFFRRAVAFDHNQIIFLDSGIDH